MPETDIFLLIRNEHEDWLTRLEALAVEAIASGNWNQLESHIAQMQEVLSDSDESQDWEVISPSSIAVIFD